jgi:hypothetical protein
MTWKYWTIYKPETKQRLDLRYDDRWGWEVDLNSNDFHMAHWEKLSKRLLPQVAPHIKKWGFKTPRKIFDENSYREMLNRLAELMNAKPGSKDAYELKMLADVIEIYEDENYPIPEPSKEDAKKFREDQERLL